MHVLQACDLSRTGSDVVGKLKPILFSANTLNKNSLSFRFSMTNEYVALSSVTIFVHLEALPTNGLFSMM